MIKLIIGNIYMENGAVIPYATLKCYGEGGFEWKTTWSDEGYKITSISSFWSVVYGDISKIVHIDWDRVVAITTSEEIEFSLEEALKLWPSMEEHIVDGA